jgi:hypothetical protein
MRIYLAGPMRNYPEFNRPAFQDGAAALRAYGHDVFSPVENDEKSGFHWGKHSGNLADAEAGGFSLRKALATDLTWICENAEAVVVLPGWGASLGVTAEVATAKALGIEVFELDQLLKGDV